MVNAGQMVVHDGILGLQKVVREASKTIIMIPKAGTGTQDTASHSVLGKHNHFTGKQRTRGTPRLGDGNKLQRFCADQQASNGTMVNVQMSVYVLSTEMVLSTNTTHAF